jgi:hypothetical protein
LAEQTIANQRELLDTLDEMRRITAEHVLHNLPNPPRRKRFA